MVNYRLSLAERPSQRHNENLFARFRFIQGAKAGSPQCNKDYSLEGLVTVHSRPAKRAQEDLSALVFALIRY